MYERLHSLSLGALVAEQPERARVFERFRIDYCCGGTRSLEQACTERRVDSDLLISHLLVNDEQTPRASTIDWRKRPLSDLVDDIVYSHHGYLRRELPRIARLLKKVIGAHGRAHPDLLELARVFRRFLVNIEAHMESEERDVFPLLKQLDDDASALWSDSAMFLRELEDEHEEAGRDLASIRRVTNNFASPPDACGTYRILMYAFLELERDMHLHVHKENNILFPRAERFLEKCEAQS
jgi:regulator of cell morphogenesis and NO signaling